MFLKTLKLSTLALASATLLAACGGGGGSTSTGGTYYTHEQLAAEFVERAYGDANIDAKLVKTNTQQYNYIVVYDYDLDSYDAYWIGGYNVGENIYDYISRNNSKMFYDLDYIGSNLYQDYYSGTTFEETSASSKDLGKLAAIKQQLRIKKSADKLKAQYGLSDESANKAARIAVSVASNPNMNKRSLDNAAKELTGATITEFQAAMKKSAQGDSKALSNLIDSAAKMNGVGPEHMNQILEGMN